MPELSKEPLILRYEDNSFALSWWPHKIYSLKSDEIFDHEVFVMDLSKKHHQSYVDGELKEKKLFEEKLQKAFQQ